MYALYVTVCPLFIMQMLFIMWYCFYFVSQVKHLSIMFQVDDGALYISYIIIFTIIIIIIALIAIVI